MRGPEEEDGERRKWWCQGGGRKSVSHLEDLQKLVGRKNGRIGKTAKAIFILGFRTENLVDRKM